jgi:hypothetical protein
MKKSIITSALLLFVQLAIFAQTPVVSTPDASTQNPKSDRGGRGGNQKGRDQRDGNREKQPKMTAADRATQYSNQLKTALTLNDDQYQKVLAVNTECITRKDAMRGGGDKGTMKTGKADIKAYRLGEFQKIFTADQMTAYQNMNDDNKEGKDGKDDGDDDKGRGKDRGGKGKWRKDSTSRRGDN